MKTSELIRRLQALIDKHGDMDVGLFGDDTNTYSETGSAGIKNAERNGAWFNSDDEGLGDRFITIN